VRDHGLGDADAGLDLQAEIAELDRLPDNVDDGLREAANEDACALSDPAQREFIWPQAGNLCLPCDARIDEIGKPVEERLNRLLPVGAGDVLEPLEFDVGDSDVQLATLARDMPAYRLLEPEAVDQAGRGIVARTHPVTFVRLGATLHRTAEGGEDGKDQGPDHEQDQAGEARRLKERRIAGTKRPP